MIHLRQSRPSRFRLSDLVAPDEIRPPVAPEGLTLLAWADARTLTTFAEDEPVPAWGQWVQANPELQPLYRDVNGTAPPSIYFTTLEQSLVHPNETLPSMSEPYTVVMCGWFDLTDAHVYVQTFNGGNMTQWDSGNEATNAWGGGNDRSSIDYQRLGLGIVHLYEVYTGLATKAIANTIGARVKGDFPHAVWETVP